MVIAGFMLLPIATIVVLALFPEDNIWPHLWSTVLFDYLRDTLLLMLGVGLGVLLIGVSTAYMVTHFRFPLSRVLEWLLLLPLAMPAYVIAYLYTDFLEFAGPVQTGVRALGGWTLANQYWFPEVRSIGGAMVLMSLVLYPYVYLLARAAFNDQSSHLLDVSRILGRGRWQTLWSVSLPIARPAIAIGVALALMETLNDFGTVDYFAIKTLTAGLYDVWLGMGNLGGAAQIAVTMLVFVLLLLSLEVFSRRKQRFYQPQQSNQTDHFESLNGWKGLVASSLCITPVLLGFVLPLALLLHFSWLYFDVSWTPEFRQYALNSLMLSTLAALTVVGIALLLTYSQRRYPSKAMNVSTRLASLGYAVPGAVLAIGVLIPLAAIDNRIDAWMRDWFGFSSGLIFSGTIVALVFAYAVRFSAMSIGALQSSYSKIPESMDLAARTLGYRPLRILFQLHLPLLKNGLLTAALVVFVDSMKELPATLLLRPFNFETLATYLYQFASNEMLGEAALSALIIVLSGLLPVVLLTRAMR